MLRPYNFGDAILRHAIIKKVLQRFPTRCTGTWIDARETCTHNALHDSGGGNEKARTVTKKSSHLPSVGET